MNEVPYIQFVFINREKQANSECLRQHCKTWCSWKFCHLLHHCHKNMGGTFTVQLFVPWASKSTVIYNVFVCVLNKP